MHRLKRTLVGERFGKLVVLSFSHRNKYDVPMWDCICDCGNTKVGNGNTLHRGDTRSCGCLRNYLPKGEAALNRVIYQYKRRSKNRNIKYTLTREQFKELTKQNCHYCKLPPSNVRKHKGQNGDLTYSGIDRLDPAKGYEVGNVVPCCERCNMAKRSQTYDEFKTWIYKVQNNKLPSMSMIMLSWSDSIYRLYTYRAKKRNLEFSLTIDLFKYLTQRTCHYCGSPPSNIHEGHHYSGLDRVDSSKGYTIDNVVTSCSTCNFAKRDTEDFHTWASSICFLC